MPTLPTFLIIHRSVSVVWLIAHRIPILGLKLELAENRYGLFCLSRFPPVKTRLSSYDVFHLMKQIATGSDNHKGDEYTYPFRPIALGVA